jgi:hypothetical protein
MTFAATGGCWGAARYVLTLAAILPACGAYSATSPTTDPTGNSGWQSALAQLQQDGAAIYSFRFTGPAPDGAFLEISIDGDGATAACARYSGEVNPSAEDYWFIDVNLGGTAAGTYTVSTDDLVGTSGTYANVALLHRYHETYAENYKAVAGTVVLTDGVMPADARSGTSVEASISVDFPDQAVQRLMCQGGQAVGDAASVAINTCDCQKASGEVTSCIIAAPGSDCCVSADGGGISFESRFSSPPCAAMCRVATGLPDYCVTVQP